jgi:glycosyltransferase involved in cell wall biosynthesis
MNQVCVIVQQVYDVDVRVRRKVDALVAAGYSVDVLALRPPRGENTYVLNGVNVHTMSLGKLRGSPARYVFEYLAFFVWTFVKLSILMRRRRYAVVEVNTLPDFLIFAAAPARWMGAKLILDMHEITPEFYISKYRTRDTSWFIRLLKWLERISFNYADHVITINEPIQDLLSERGLSRSKSTVIMNAADESRFAATPPTADGAAPSGSSKFVMMYHGTLTNIYGLDIAIEAFNRAHHEMPGAELWILGSGPEASHLNSLVERYELGSKVKLLGEVLPSQIPGLLKQCTVGVLPIRRDVFLDFAFPNKLPELVIMGKTVIVSRLKAIRTYFSETALAYFEPNSSQDLANTMVGLYRDPGLRERLAQRAKLEYVGIRWDIMKDRYLTLVEGLVPATGKPDQALSYRRDGRVA